MRSCDQDLRRASEAGAQLGARGRCVHCGRHVKMREDKDGMDVALAHRRRPLTLLGYHPAVTTVNRLPPPQKYSQPNPGSTSLLSSLRSLSSHRTAPSTVSGARGGSL